MDRRKYKPRRGLHQNLMEPSTSKASTPVMEYQESEDMFSSSHRSTASSQRQSALELLRKRTQTPILNREELSQAPQRNEDPRLSSKRERAETATGGSPAKNPRLESSTDKLRKLTQNTEKPRDSTFKHKKLLSQQPESTSKSNKSPVKSSKTLKTPERFESFAQARLQRTPPRASESPLKSSTRTLQKIPETSASLSSRISQVKSPQESDKENRTRSKNPTISFDSSSSSDEEPTIRREATLLERFLEQSGVRISVDNDDQFSITTNPAGIVKKIQQVLSSGDFAESDVIRDWEKSLENTDNMKRYLNPTILDSDQRLLNSVNNVSVARILLQVPLIQTEVLSSLLRRLNEEVLVKDSPEEVSWACLLLSQLRFLEIVTDADAMTSRLEELLETSPDWFQRELIAYLPDIVTDSHHQSIADMLCKLLDTDSDLKQVILDCITSLTLGKEYLEELRNKILLIMESNNDITEIPAMVKFCLYECPSVEVCQKVLKTVRELQLQPLDNSNLEECYTSQMMTVNALKMSFIMTKVAPKAALSIVSEVHESSPKVLDLIMMLLLCADGPKKKVAENVLKKHIKSGYYRISLLNAFYRDFEQVAKDFQPIVLNLASSLLKSEDCALVDFGGEWFRCQFLAHSKMYHKQSEIIGKLILLMGNNDQTAKHALSVLCKMTEKREEKDQLQKHCNELTVLMEKIDKFDLEEVATMNDLLHALCNNLDSSAEALRDDLFILLQKQLSNTDAVIKCKGVIGAVMSIKHLARHQESCDLAREILTKVEVGVKDCPRAQALFFDKMGQVIDSDEGIDRKFVRSVTTSYEDELATKYMTDNDSYRGDLTPNFALNHSDSSPEMFIDFGETKYGAVVPILFRMIRICHQHLNENRDLEDVSAVLGCGLMMPRDMDLPEPRTLDLIFHCINWYRELINAYITQSDEIMKTQVVQRLDNLMNLQGELSTLLSLAEVRYQPPPCYFHKYPPPPFNRVEKKAGKKSGKKKDSDRSNSTSVPEWEAWEHGSALTIKNPMYFRRLDATIVHFLDNDVGKDLTPGHICFIIKELLAMLDDESVATQFFLRKLIKLLPMICAKLSQLVSEVRSDDNSQQKQAVALILSLLSKIFSWKGLNSTTHHGMLRDGLRILASQRDEANGTLRAAAELVAESYAYFESLADIATQIAVAHELVNMCKTLMKHSETFTREHKEKQAKMAYAFLCLEWPDDRHLASSYKTAVTGLLKNWMDHETNPLKTVSSVIEWLPEEVEKMEKPQDKLGRLPTINRANFHCLFQKLFDGLIKGAKISLGSAHGDTAKLQVWKEVGENLQCLVKVCKTVPTKATLMTYLRHIPSLLKLFITLGMPVLEHNLRYQPEDVTGVLKMMQGGTRYLHAVCCHSTEKKDVALTKLIPAAKTILEQLVYCVKGMLVLNNSATAFWMGNLVNKDLDGHEILSQTSMSTDEPSIPEMTNENSNLSADGSVSDILDDDQDNNDDSMDA